MQRDTQIRLAETLLRYVDTGAMYSAGEVVANPVTAYSDAAQWQAERTKLFRGQPQVVGLSSRLASPGDWVTFELPDLPGEKVQRHDRPGCKRDDHYDGNAWDTNVNAVAEVRSRPPIVRVPTALRSTLARMNPKTVFVNTPATAAPR